MAISKLPTTTDAGIPNLIRRLSDDSKRLVSDEARLAKLEIRESLERGGKGVMLLAVAFGLGVLAAVTFTLFLVTLVGRVAGRMWIGAVVVGVVELLAGALLLKHGATTLKGNKPAA
jgi:hypothetical protein